MKYANVNFIYIWIFLLISLNACNPFFESQEEFDNRCADFLPLEYEALKDTTYGVVMKRKLIGNPLFNEISSHVIFQTRYLKNKQTEFQYLWTIEKIGQGKYRYDTLAFKFDAQANLKGLMSRSSENSRVNLERKSSIFHKNCIEVINHEGIDSQGNKVSIFWTYKFGVLKYVSPYAEKSFELGPLENKEIQEILDKLKRMEY